MLLHDPRLYIASLLIAKIKNMASALFAMAATILAVLFYGMHAVITCNNDKNQIVKEQKARIHGK